MKGYETCPMCRWFASKKGNLQQFISTWPRKMLVHQRVILVFSRSHPLSLMILLQVKSQEGKESADHSRGSWSDVREHLGEKATDGMPQMVSGHFERVSSFLLVFDTHCNALGYTFIYICIICRYICNMYLLHVYIYNPLRNNLSKMGVLGDPLKHFF